MAEQVRSFWSPVIRPTILSPRTILRGQAEALARQTRGLLLADIREKSSDAGKSIISFDFVVPALDSYRHRILSVAHEPDLPYPAVIDAEVFKLNRNIYRRFIEGRQNIIDDPEAGNVAISDSQFIAIISTVLQSSHVVSAAQSLIARATEILAENDRQYLDAPDKDGLPSDSTDGEES